MREKNKNYHTKSANSNNGFWDRRADERAERMLVVADRNGVSNFFDLSPTERALAYDNEDDG